MRYALFADIHGNPIALDAVLADIEVQGGVDGYWVLGDIAPLGHDPAGAIERLVGLPQACFLQGNGDRYITTGALPRAALRNAVGDEARVQELVTGAKGLAWTQGYVTAAGQLDWLTALPTEQRTVLPDGTRMLAVHGIPGDDETGITPTATDTELQHWLNGCAADLVFVAHTHWPLDRLLPATEHTSSLRVVNVGSVSNPIVPDLRASYALLDVHPSGHEIRLRSVPYDVGAVLAAIDRSQHPSTAFIRSYFLGERRPPWQTAHR